jgi:hypothetical protein
MGLTIIMGNVRRVMCKVPLTSMHKPISKYHYALVSSPRSLEPKSKKHNISNKDINNFVPTPFLNNINTVNPKFQLFIHPLLTYKILLLLATKFKIPKFQPKPTYTLLNSLTQALDSKK